LQFSQITVNDFPLIAAPVPFLAQFRMIMCSEGPKSDALGFLVSKRPMQTSTYTTNEIIIPLSANGHGCLTRLILPTFAQEIINRFAVAMTLWLGRGHS
jgi:hypothetical protein